MDIIISSATGIFNAVTTFVSSLFATVTGSASDVVSSVSK